MELIPHPGEGLRCSVMMLGSHESQLSHPKIVVIYMNEVPRVFLKLNSTKFPNYYPRESLKKYPWQE